MRSMMAFHNWKVIFTPTFPENVPDHYWAPANNLDSTTPSSSSSSSSSPFHKFTCLNRHDSYIKSLIISYAVVHMGQSGTNSPNWFSQTSKIRPRKLENSYSFFFFVKAEVRNKNTGDGIDCEMFFCERVPSFRIFVTRNFVKNTNFWPLILLNPGDCTQ